MNVTYKILVSQGDRFGGALDGAANQFSEAYDSGQIPMDFVNGMRKKGQLIMGIGHRVKSVSEEQIIEHSCQCLILWSAISHGLITHSQREAYMVWV